MTSHLGLMVIFSLFVSVVFAVLTRDEPMEQIKFGARLFGGFVGAGILMGWLLCPTSAVAVLQRSHTSRARQLWLWVPVVAYKRRSSSSRTCRSRRCRRRCPTRRLTCGPMRAWRCSRCGPSVAAYRVAWRCAWRVLAFAIAAGYGISDELHQLFGRGDQEISSTGLLTPAAPSSALEPAGCGVSLRSRHRV